MKIEIREFSDLSIEEKDVCSHFFCRMPFKPNPKARGSSIDFMQWASVVRERDRRALERRFVLWQFADHSQPLGSVLIRKLSYMSWAGMMHTAFTRKSFDLGLMTATCQYALSRALDELFLQYIAVGALPINPYSNKLYASIPLREEKSLSLALSRYSGFPVNGYSMNLSSPRENWNDHSVINTDVKCGLEGGYEVALEPEAIPVETTQTTQSDGPIAQQSYI